MVHFHSFILCFFPPLFTTPVLVILPSFRNMFHDGLESLWRTSASRLPQPHCWFLASGLGILVHSGVQRFAVLRRDGKPSVAWLSRHLRIPLASCFSPTLMHFRILQGSVAMTSYLTNICAWGWSLFHTNMFCTLNLLQTTWKSKAISKSPRFHYMFVSLQSYTCLARSRPLSQIKGEHSLDICFAQRIAARNRWSNSFLREIHCRTFKPGSLPKPSDWGNPLTHGSHIEAQLCLQNFR